MANCFSVHRGIPSSVFNWLANVFTHSPWNTVNKINRCICWITESPLFSLYVWGLRLCIQVLNLWEVRIIILFFFFYQAQQTTPFWVHCQLGELIMVNVKVLVTQSCFFATPRTVAHQAPLSMGFSRQEYRSGLPCPPPGDLPDPGDRTRAFHIAGRFFTVRATREAQIMVKEKKKVINMISWDT